MQPHYLLDTNTVSYILKGNFPRVRHRLVKTPMEQLAISAITEGELRFGVARRPDATKLKIAVEEFLLRVTSLLWDSQAALHYGELRAELEAPGKPMGNLDTMIAAHALAVGAVLVTHDRVFRQVKQLKLEDWTR